MRSSLGSTMNGDQSAMLESNLNQNSQLPPDESHLTILDEDSSAHTNSKTLFKFGGLSREIELIKNLTAQKQKGQMETRNANADFDTYYMTQYSKGSLFDLNRVEEEDQQISQDELDSTSSPFKIQDQQQYMSQTMGGLYQKRSKKIINKYVNNQNYLKKSIVSKVNSKNTSSRSKRNLDQIGLDAYGQIQPSQTLNEWSTGSIQVNEDYPSPSRERSKVQAYLNSRRGSTHQPLRRITMKESKKTKISNNEVIPSNESRYSQAKTNKHSRNSAKSKMILDQSSYSTLQQVKAVKQMKIADYFQTNKLISGSSRPYEDVLDISKEVSLELNTLMSRNDENLRTTSSLLEDSNAGSIYLPSLGSNFPQNILKTGESLKYDLIDIDHAYNNVSHQLSTIGSPTSQYAAIAKLTKNQDIISKLKEKKQLLRREKWQIVMAYMAKNPNFLLDVLPKTNKENVSRSPPQRSQYKESITVTDQLESIDVGELLGKPKKKKIILKGSSVIEHYRKMQKMIESKRNADLAAIEVEKKAKIDQSIFAIFDDPNITNARNQVAQHRHVASTGDDLAYRDIKLSDNSTFSYDTSNKSDQKHQQNYSQSSLFHRSLFQQGAAIHKHQQSDNAIPPPLLLKQSNYNSRNPYNAYTSIQRHYQIYLHILKTNTRQIPDVSAKALSTHQQASSHYSQVATKSMNTKRDKFSMRPEPTQAHVEENFVPKNDPDMRQTVDFSALDIKKYIDERPEMPDEDMTQSNSQVYASFEIQQALHQIRINEKTIKNKKEIEFYYYRAIKTFELLCYQLGLTKLAKHIYQHYHEHNLKTISKILYRCQDFFVIRTEIINLLRVIAHREQILLSLRLFVQDLDEKRDNRLLERIKSKKSMHLLMLGKDLESTTKEVTVKIEAFLAKYKKYFGTIFGYEGTDYVMASRKEVEEIMDMIRTIRDEDAANEEHQDNKKAILNVESQTAFGVDL